MSETRMGVERAFIMLSSGDALEHVKDSAFDTLTSGGGQHNIPHEYCLYTEGEQLINVLLHSSDGTFMSFMCCSIGRRKKTLRLISVLPWTPSFTGDVVFNINENGILSTPTLKGMEDKEFTHYTLKVL